FRVHTSPRTALASPLSLSMPPPPTRLYPLSLHDALPICRFDPAEALRLMAGERVSNLYLVPTLYHDLVHHPLFAETDTSSVRKRSEEHTSELQSLTNLVCRLLLEKKKIPHIPRMRTN